MTALGYQNIPARIDRLRAHLKSRRGRRDRQALELLARLCRFYKDRTSSTIASVDDLLKTYYDVTNDNPLYTLPTPFFAMLKKADPLCPDNRAYVVPLEMPVSHSYDEDDPIRSKTTQAYRDNWDRVFGEEKPPEPTPETDAMFVKVPINCTQPGWNGIAKLDEPPRYSCAKCCDTGCVPDPNADPSTFVTEADGLVNCDECSIRGKQLP